MSSRMSVRRTTTASSSASIRRSRGLKGLVLAALLGIALAVGVFVQSTGADSEGDDVLRLSVSG